MVVGRCEGFAYLASPGRPTDIGLSWARPAILVACKGRGGMFLFLLFLYFHSCSSFFPGGGRVVRRCCVSYITGASNGYWLTVGQGLLSL